MKTRSFFARCAMLLGLSLMLTLACQKLEVDEPYSTDPHETTENPNVFNVGGEDAISPRSDESTPTILGNLRVNPFTTEVMTQAWENLTGQTLTSPLPATHQYVKFLPATLDQFKKLNETDLILFDYPLEYEIVQLGDYYDDPAVPAGGIPPLYAVVESGVTLPASIPHEIKAQLLLAPNDSYLVKEAFRLTGNNYNDSYVGSGGTGTGRPDPECNTGCPNYPCCLDPDIFCDDIPCVTDPDPCQPGSPNWPECLGGGNGGGGGSSEFTQNDCGCTVFSDIRKPGGCIKVLDTQLPDNTTIGGVSVHMEGIKQVKVIFKDDWFTTSSTFTDMNGCWKINRRHSGRTWMWVEFKSSRTIIRGYKLGWRIWELYTPVKDYVGVIAGPVFNNIQLNYLPANDDDGNSKRFWYAATANNALYDYDGFAQQDGILPPPGQTIILLTNIPGAAAAPMFAKMPQVALQLQASLPGISFAMFEIFGMDVTIGIPPLPVTLDIGLLLNPAAVPDIVYNYGERVGEPSDEVKETFYHEFAHASHFAGVNNIAYFHDNINYILGNATSGNNSPYGSRGTPGFEQCAIIEMWGYHVGPQYADRQYGVFHSRTLSSNSVIIEQTRWKYQKESFVPDFLGSSDPDGWIPEGLCLDLIDDNAQNPAGVQEGLGQNADPIKGFTILSFFNAISTNTPTKLTDVETNLQSALPLGVSATDLRAMLALYGY